MSQRASHLRAFLLPDTILAAGAYISQIDNYYKNIIIIYTSLNSHTHGVLSYHYQSKSSLLAAIPEQRHPESHSRRFALIRGQIVFAAGPRACIAFFLHKARRPSSSAMTALKLGLSSFSGRHPLAPTRIMLMTGITARPSTTTLLSIRRASGPLFGRSAFALVVRCVFKFFIA